MVGLLCAGISVSAARSLPPLRARFLHYCLLGSWQSKKHAHLARIIRRSSLNSVLYTARVFRPCALLGPRSPDGLPSAFKFRDFIGGYSCTPYVTISDETLRHTGPCARGEACTPPPAKSGYSVASMRRHNFFLLSSTARYVRCRWSACSNASSMP